jgi:hypothetical protein
MVERNMREQFTRLINWVNISFYVSYIRVGIVASMENVRRNISEESYVKLYEAAILPSLGSQNYFALRWLSKTISRWN